MKKLILIQKTLQTRRMLQTDEDTLKNQLQMALDGFVNEENKPSETIDSSAKDVNEDDSEDDDLQFIDLN